MAFPTNQTVSRLGQTNAAGDERSLLLKLYAGEVLTAFEERNIFMPLHRTRTISKGKSAQFPMVGTAVAKYHTPGELIQGDAIKHGERVVTVDSLLISSQFIDSVDELMNHYDVRSIYSKEAGNALSNQLDRNMARIIAKSASITTKNLGITAGIGGFDDEVFTSNVNIGTTVAHATDGSKIAQAIYDALKEFDSKDITGEKVCVLPPAQYYSLFNVSGDVNTLAYMNKDVGGSGSLSSGTVPVIGGVKILMSNHIPQTDQSTAALWNSNAGGDSDPIATGRSGSYFGNYSKVRGLMFSRDAAATVKLKDLSVESEYQINRQGSLFVSKYAMGHNILRPACAISLNSV